MTALRHRPRRPQRRRPRPLDRLLRPGVRLGVQGRGDGYAFLGDDDRLVLTLWQQSSGTFADRPARAAPPLLPGRLDRRRERGRGARARARAQALPRRHRAPRRGPVAAAGSSSRTPTGSGSRSSPARAPTPISAPRAPPRPAGSSRPCGTRASAPSRSAPASPSARTGCSARQEPVIPPVAREFLAEQPWIVLGAADAHGRVWASPLYGEPGFVTTPDERPCTSRRSRSKATRSRRDRQRGRRARARAGHAPADAAQRPGDQRDDGITIALEQVFSNCPKYIATRHAMPSRRSARAQPGASAWTPGAQLLARADTAFVATRAPEGADVSHRGGRPGFLRVDGDTVSWPDFQGNAMFNTLGNLVVDPALRAHRRRPGGRHDAVPDGTRDGRRRPPRRRCTSTARSNSSTPRRWAGGWNARGATRATPEAAGARRRAATRRPAPRSAAR